MDFYPYCQPSYVGRLAMKHFYTFHRFYWCKFYKGQPYVKIVIEMIKTWDYNSVVHLEVVIAVDYFCGFLLQMHIDSHDALGVLNTLFEILAPSSLRPVDMLLRSMFVTPKTMVSK